MDKIIKPIKKLEGTVNPPADKSISHRSIIFSSIAEGKNKIYNFLRAEDCMCTLNAFKSMGVSIHDDGKVITIEGKGLRSLKLQKSPIYLGNSGTSMRLIPGVLAGQNFTTILEGDESLSNRPMKRIIEPLREMGVIISSNNDKMTPPLNIDGALSKLKPIKYVSKIASAQVKSCVLLAALYANGKTTFSEPFRSRDHTEKMLEYFEANIQINDNVVSVESPTKLISKDIFVPSDISSAAFFMVGGLLFEGSRVTLKNVGINPTRTGIIDVLKRMGASLEITNVNNTLEPVADIIVSSSNLNGTTIEESEIPLLIDEVPILTVAAAFASSPTIIKGIKELKVKETDRAHSMITNLSKMGVVIKEENDQLYIEGRASKLKGGVFESFGDHRTVMSMAIAGLKAINSSTIKGIDCINTSYPQFFDDLDAISK
ncbi:MAG: 3-phosphoshikimate 1-carboxyvinyltransferase [Candidatus Omnitrophica bacterium]|nr:3-phosphoshikimate 1-carboxyvinyltransferase [Candidatus Omnitrophota bacterium]